MKKFLLIFGLFIISCNSITNFKNSSKIHHKKNRISNSLIKEWYLKDYLMDTIPGISVDKLFSSLKKTHFKATTTVAVVDMLIDTKHDVFKNLLWINHNEIPNNNIDDDNNGYVDDINGWNFLGVNNDSTIRYTNTDYTRILRDSIYYKVKDSNLFKKAKNTYFKNLKKYNKRIKDWDWYINAFIDYERYFDSIFHKKRYTTKDIDSIYKLYKKTNHKKLNLVSNYKSFIDDNFTLDRLISDKNHFKLIVNNCFNLNEDPRSLIDKFPNDITKIGYGNNNISLKYKNTTHGTNVNGIIGLIQEKIKHPFIKIMPLAIMRYGREHDKDIALAIRYAVDNGAKIINLSIGKTYSTHNHFVNEALKYAESKNVLVITSSGNRAINLDYNIEYPNDFNSNNIEFVKNFITVGGITYNTDSTFVSKFSNYGKQNVDLFAPATKIYSATPSNKYNFGNGTSYAAPMVSTIAAILFSYFPELTAKEVKDIILKSGTAYDLEVIVPGTKDKKVHFSELSKSGKVLNAYNAFKVAEEYVKNKKIK